MGSTKVNIDELLPQFKNLKAEMKATNLDAKTAAKNIGGVDKSVLKYCSSTDLANQSQKGFRASLQQTTFAAKAQTVAFKGLAIVANTIASIAIFTIVSKVISGIDSLIHSTEECKERVDELMSSYNSALDTANSNASKVEELADKYEELSKGVNNLGENVSLTTEEYKEYNSIVNDVANMFPTLVSGYTDEGNAILALKGNVEQLRDAYKEAQQEAHLSLIEGKDDIMQNLKNLTTEEEYVDWGLRYSATGNEKYDYIRRFIDAATDVNTLSKFEESSNVKELEWFKTLVAKYAPFTETDSLSPEDLSKIRSNAQIMVQEFDLEVQQALSANKSLANTYLNMNDTYNNLENNQLKTAMSLMINSIDTEIATTHDIGEYVNDIVNTISSDSALQDALIDLFSFTPEDFSPTQAKQQIDEYINTIANLIGEDSAKLKVRLGFDAIDDLATKYENAIQTAKDKFKGEDLTFFFEKNSINTQEKIDKWIECANSCNTATEAMKKCLGIDSSNAAINSTISETIDSLNKKLKPSLELLKSAYQEIFSVQDGEEIFSLENVDWDVFEQIKTSLEELSKIGIDIDTLQFDSFVKTLSNSASTATEVQNSFNALASSIIKSSKTTDNLNKETAQFIITSLKQMGVSNAQEVVTQALANKTEELAIKEQFLSETGGILSNVTADKINGFLNYSQVSETARASLFKLITQEQVFNNTSLDANAKIKELAKLAASFGDVVLSAKIAIHSMAFLTPSVSNVPKIVQSVISGKSLDEMFLEDAENYINNSQAKVPPIIFGEQTNSNPPQNKKSSDSNKSSGDSSSEDLWKKAYENEKKELDHLRKIELITEQGYYDKLSALTDKYFAGQEKYIDEYRSNIEELYNLKKELFSDSVSDIEHQISVLDNNKSNDTFEEQTALYSRLQKMYAKEANRAREHGLSDSDSYVQQQQKSYMEVTDKIYELQKNSYEKIISSNENLIEKLANRTNTEQQRINAILKTTEKAHKFANLRRSQGFSEDSEDILNAQKTYIDGIKQIFDILNEEFDKIIDKKDNLIDDIDFKINVLGEKDFDEQERLINEQLLISIEKVKDYDSEIKRLEKDYINSTITAAEYEERVRSLKEAQQSATLAIKEYHEQLRDIEISKLDEQIDKITRATEKQTDAIDKQIEALEDENDELNKLKNLYDSAYRAVQKVINDQIEELNDLKEQEEEYWSEKLDALEKINQETQRGIELSEKKKAVEEASQRTALVYHEDRGWVHEANPNDLSAAQQDLDRWLIDDQFEQAKKSIEEQKEAALSAIEEQIESWNNYLEKWEDAVAAYEEGQDRLAAKAVIGANWERSTLAQRENIIRNFEKKYSEICAKLDEDSNNSIAKQKEALENQKNEIEKASDSEITAIENLKSAFEELFDVTTLDSAEWVNSLVEKFNLTEEAAKSLFKVLSSYNGDMGNVLPPSLLDTKDNDFVITTIKQMEANSISWNKQQSQTGKDKLYNENENLAKSLEKYGINAYFDKSSGVWYDQDNNKLYSLLAKNTETNSTSLYDNTNKTQDNTESADNNTSSTNNNSKILKENSKAINVMSGITNDVIDVAETLTEALQNGSSSGNGSGNSGNSGGSENTNTTPTDGTLYSYVSKLSGDDITTAEKWFEDNKITNPGTSLIVVKGGATSLSSSIIEQLGLKSKSLVSLGSKLYYISGSGYSKVGSLVNQYAKGSKYIPFNQKALVDEEGEELILHKDMSGRITSLEKGDEVVPANKTQALLHLLNNQIGANIKPPEGSSVLQYDNSIVDLAEIAKENFENYCFSNFRENCIPKMPDYDMNISNNTTNYNNNINSVELKNINNCEDVFKGLSNMARQRAFRR